MTGPIIVGVDGSPTAQRAAQKARDLALKLDVALHVVSAHTDATIEHVNSGSDQGWSRAPTTRSTSPSRWSEVCAPPG